MTRTEVRRAYPWQIFSCYSRNTEDDTDEVEGGEPERTSGWDYDLTRVERSYRLLYHQDGYAKVRLVRSPPLKGTRTKWVRFPPGPEAARFPVSPFPIESVLLEERPEVVVVAAGSFACVYRKVRGFTEQLLPATIETWTDPTLPLPLQRVVTWHDPSAPETYKNVERTTLLSLSLAPLPTEPD